MLKIDLLGLVLVIILPRAPEYSKSTSWDRFWPYFCPGRQHVQNRSLGVGFGHNPTQGARMFKIDAAVASPQEEERATTRKGSPAPSSRRGQGEYATTTHVLRQHATFTGVPSHRWDATSAQAYSQSFCAAIGGTGCSASVSRVLVESPGAQLRRALGFVEALIGTPYEMWRGQMPNEGT